MQLPYQIHLNVLKLDWGVSLYLFFKALNERNFVLTFLHSSIRVYYNQYIQSKVIIQPEESDTTLHLHCVRFFSYALVSQRDTFQMLFIYAVFV